MFDQATEIIYTLSSDGRITSLNPAFERALGWSAADLGLSAEAVGKAGAMYEVKEIFIPAKKSKVEMLGGSPEEAAAALVEKLRKEAKVL